MHFNIFIIQLGKRNQGKDVKVTLEEEKKHTE